MEWFFQHALVSHAQRLVQHRQIKHFNFRFHIVVAHFLSELAHETWMVLVDDRGEITGACGERCHVTAQMQHAAALGPPARATTG